MQRGVLTRTHATFPIFRQSFVHLRNGQDLYARYPQEQGTEERDRFKYSPSAALFFAPFAILPFVLGLFAWTLLNSIAVYVAVNRLLPARDAPVALLIIFPALIASVQSTSSNGVIAALMLFSFIALERGRVVGASSAVAVGALMKLFPAAAVPFVLWQPRPWRALGQLVLVFALMLAAPLLVTAPDQLLGQYRSWVAILTADAGDLTFARSIMVVVRAWTGSTVPNWMFQAAATGILITPLVVRRSAWRDPLFRQQFLASLLIYAVIFNHQAENASYVIAAAGLAVWFMASPKTWPRVVLMLLCVAGLEAVPYALVWFWLQMDLLDGGRLWGWLKTQLPSETRIQGAFEPERLEA